MPEIQIHIFDSASGPVYEIITTTILADKQDRRLLEKAPSGF